MGGILIFIVLAQTLNEIATGPSQLQKKIFAQKVFGSNLFLKNRELQFTPQTQWAALCAARLDYEKNPKSFAMVFPYKNVRTYFTKNS